MTSAQTTDKDTETLYTLGPLESILLTALPLAAGTAIGGLFLTGELEPLALLDPGPAVRYGLPIARAVHDVAAALTIGLLLVASYAVPGQSKVPRAMSFGQWVASRWAGAAAAIWVLAGAAVLVLTTANSIGQPVNSPGFVRQVIFFSTQLELGQSLLVSICLAGIAALLLIQPLGLTRTAIAAVFALAALLPLALSGHAAGSDEHANAVNSLALHLVGACVWAGGLAAVFMLRSRLGPDLGRTLERYSQLALGAFVLVVFSGTVNASLRLASPSELLTSTYGNLLGLKVLAVIALGVAGWKQRRVVIPQLGRPSTRRAAFTRLTVTELAIMVLTFGISVALSRSAPPVPQDPVVGDLRHALLGFPYPPPVSVGNFLTQVHPDWLFIFIALVLACFYLAGVARLRRRGDPWPLSRTVWWLAGCALLIWVTSGGPGVYGSVHFSTHMIQHMGLMMYVPLPLVMGTPVLLALRALPTRRDASRGAREWVLVLLHSRYSTFLTRPAVAGAIFAGSLVVFYYTGWFNYALTEHPGHILMQVHFLLSGYLFFWVLIGRDPSQNKPPHLIRVIVLFVTMAFHAFFGVAVMSSTDVLGQPWWAAMQYLDQEALLADQRVGAGIAWGAGELPVVIAVVIIVQQWFADDTRAATRLDRRAARDEDAALRAYNDHLRTLNRGEA